MRTAKLTGERKPVTALFADVVGSTTLAESIDPEDWTQMMNEAFDVMSKAVFHYEGTIAQLQGDAMLAFFGAPVAHEDDPDRAIRAALEMVAGIEEFSRQLKVSNGIDFRIRAGINTGPVVVGNVGTDLRYEYTALGDAVNIAARVQTAAEPGTVLVSANTQRFVTDAFDFDDLGEVPLKGKTEAVQLYRVRGLRAVPGRRRGLESVGISSPLVGRAAELEKLLALFAVVRAGRGRLAVLVGEPGIGKSRLLAELRTGIGADDAVPGADAASGAANAATWFEGRCVSYGRSAPYHLVFGDLVRRPCFKGSRSAPPIQTRGSRSSSSASSESARRLSAHAARLYLAHLLALPLIASRSQIAPSWRSLECSQGPVCRPRSAPRPVRAARR